MSEQIRLIAGEDPDALVLRAKRRWSPIKTFCLFSGGNDSAVVARRCRDHYDELFFIDTGTAVPGVEEFVREFAGFLGKPVSILRSGSTYREMVLNHGFPGKAKHNIAYSLLKERRIEEMLRLTKQGHPRSASVLFISGVRRDESSRRSGRPSMSERGSAKFVNPLIDWTNADMLQYRRAYGLPQSDPAALCHRSMECNCGAFADAEQERGMIRDLWPEWFEDNIASLEREAEALGVRWCRWGGYDIHGNQAAGSGEMPADALCSENCQQTLAVAA